MKTLKDIKVDVGQGEGYYVYLLFKPDGTPFYVGKGKSNRISAHEAEARYFKNGRTWKGINNFKLNTILKIWREDETVLYEIDSWHETSKEAANREIELVKEIGRRVLSEGPLTNIRSGGDLMSEEDRRLFGEKIRQHYIDHPEARDRLSQSIKQHYIDHPEARDRASERQIQLYIDHPEMKDQISQSMSDYIEANPDFVINLQAAKDEWIANCPEEYAETEKERIGIMKTSEHREKMSEVMRNYFAEHPEERERLVAQGVLFWGDNEEACEGARQRAIENKSHEAIIRWLRECPEECREKWDRHSEYMKQWYQENPEKALELVESRNQVLRTSEHRQKMSRKTKQYMDTHPDVVADRVDAMKRALGDRCDVKQKCLLAVQHKLYEEGEIKRLRDHISHKILHRWRSKGLINRYFPQMPFGSAKKAEWEQFQKGLAT